jgi:hypothetical protein
MEYVDAAAYVLACDNDYPHFRRYKEASEAASVLLEALARTAGVAVEAKREELQGKVRSRARRDYGITA